MESLTVFLIVAITWLPVGFLSMFIAWYFSDRKIGVNFTGNDAKAMFFGYFMPIIIIVLIADDFLKDDKVIFKGKK
jgi:hypothetical protein